MTQSTRKLIGIILTLVVLVAYAAIITAIYDTFLVGVQPIILVVFFAVAGLAWCLPTMAIIRWMAKPDKA
ncbi:MAG TPA: DUF2842 domain-containing protein [Devosiaceae bacterium]|jgi:hypothetical protein